MSVNEQATSHSSFADTSTDCAICLEPLYDTTNDHGRVIALTCGHKWHYDCIVRQLQTAQPSSKQRLLFTGCQCAKCGSICDHPDLRDLTRTTDVLRGKVDQLLEEQLALDAPDLWKQAQQSSQSRKATLDHARRKYAFYLCSHCREPYFGGTVECADQVANGGDEESSEERLCVACAPQPQITCRNPLEHRGHLIWKCRYCCRPSTHLCYGNVHFCDDCHDRNSQRVRQLQQQHQRSAKPPSLSPIPCLGADCPYPKPENSSTHSNGTTPRSEQVYGCAWCQSTAEQGDAANIVEPGSENLLQNSSGQLGMQGWRQLNRSMSWTVETSELPVDATTTTNFVSSYLPCAMEQTLDLSTLFTTIEENMSVEVSARYMGRTDCPSVFCLKAFFLNEHRQIDSQQATPVLESPPDYWERARVVIPTTSTARYLSVVVIGKDSRFWQGRFGSKVTNISVRLLGPPEEIQPLLIRRRHDNNNMNNLTTTVHHHHHQVRRDMTAVDDDDEDIDEQQQQRRIMPAQSPVVMLLREGLLPIVCVLILAWLLQNS